MHPGHNNEMNLNFQNPSQEDGGNYIVRAVNEVGDKDCTLALNFGELYFPSETRIRNPSRLKGSLIFKGVK